MATNTFRLHYLAKAAAGVPRDLVNTFVSAKFHAIRPTVLIYNCTWVCDARCTMCSNWKWGDRKSDMTLAQLEPVLDSPFWGAVENLNISGGEPTTRNDLPEMVELFQRHLPRMRKIGINTTGLTPKRAIPMLTRIVEFCAEKGILISIRVSLDGIGDVHDQVRAVKKGFDKACQTIEAMQALAKTHDNFSFGIASTIFATNLTDAENILAWARTKGLDAAFARHRVDAIVAPTTGAPGLIDLVNGDPGGPSSTTPCAVAGYPALTVPMGYVRGLPLGLTFMGRPWSEATLLKLAYACEQASKVRKAPAFRATAEL